MKVLDERTTENAHPYQKVWMWSVLDSPRLQRRGQADLCLHQSQHLIFLEPRFPLHLSGVLHNLSKPVSNKAANLQHSRLSWRAMAESTATPKVHGICCDDISGFVQAGSQYQLRHRQVVVGFPPVSCLFCETVCFSHIRAL